MQKFKVIEKMLSYVKLICMEKIISYLLTYIKDLQSLKKKNSTNTLFIKQKVLIPKHQNTKLVSCHGNRAAENLKRRERQRESFHSLTTRIKEISNSVSECDTKAHCGVLPENEASHRL